MAAPVLPPPPPGEPRRKAFTRKEVERMERLGLLQGRYELVEGDLIDKMRQNPPHAAAFRLLLAFLASVVRITQVRIQLPIEVALGDQEYSEPQPDIAVVGNEFDEHRKRHPRGEELLLAIEISDTTLRFDKQTKAALYARAGVPEYWVVDAVRREFTIYRGPIDGAWASVEQVGPDGSICFGNSTQPVSALLD